MPRRLGHSVGNHVCDASLEDEIGRAALGADHDYFLGRTHAEEREEGLYAVNRSEGIDFELG